MTSMPSRLSHLACYLGISVGGWPATVTVLRTGRGSATPRKVPVEQLVALLADGVDVGTIANTFECTTRTVRNTAARHGVTIPPKHRRYPSSAPRQRTVTHQVLWEPDWLQQRFDAGATLRAVATEAACTVSAVRHAADRLGVVRRRAAQHPLLRDRTWLQDRYVAEGRSIAAIGRSLGVSGTAVAHALQRAGIPTRPKPAHGLGDVLVAAYVNDQLTGIEVAATFGVHANTVYAALRRAGVTARPARRASPKLRSPGWLAAQLDTGMTVSAIAAEVGCTPKTVRTVADQLGLHRPRRRPELRDRTWLTRRHTATGGNLEAIAAELGVSARTIADALRRQGLGRRRRRRIGALHDRGWLQRRHVVDGASTVELATELGCSAASVRRALRRHGLGVPDSRHPRLADTDWLRRQYIDHGRSMRAIGRELGVSDATVNRSLRRHGLRSQ